MAEDFSIATLETQRQQEKNNFKILRNTDFQSRIQYPWNYQWIEKVTSSSLPVWRKKMTRFKENSKALEDMSSRQWN